MKPTTIEVTHSHSDAGNCREYYRTIPNGQLICKQDEGANHLWYSCIDDNCWEEPDFAINTDKYNLVVVGGAK